MVSHEDHKFMIVVIGDTSVGKSTLLKKLIEPDLAIDELSQHITTIGVDFLVKNLYVLGS